MKLRHPGLIGLVALLASWLVRVWMGTVRCRMVNLDGKNHPVDPRREPHIYALWHEALLFPTLFRARVKSLVSKHSDGELIARVMKHLGGDPVRGSTTRGGLAGLMQMVHQSSSWHLAVTPDGPRGPRRKLQAGVVMVASLTGLPLIPVGLTFAPAWRAGSWDRMLVPKPWCTGYGVVGTPIFVPANIGKPDLERYRRYVEDELNRLTLAAERWAAEGIRPCAPPVPAAPAPLPAYRRAA